MDTKQQIRSRVLQALYAARSADPSQSVGVEDVAKQLDLSRDVLGLEIAYLDERDYLRSKSRTLRGRVFSTLELTAKGVDYVEGRVGGGRLDDVRTDPAQSKYAVIEQANPERPLRVFLCHASADKPHARDLYHQLRQAGVDPWLDEEKLLPGQEWEPGIHEAVRSSDIVIVCLSSKSVNKVGFVQKEIRYALDVADEQPEGAIYLIPLRLDECQVPNRLQRWQWVDLFQEGGYARLVAALRSRAEFFGLALPSDPAPLDGVSKGR